MSQYEAEAQRIVDHVLQAKGPYPKPSGKSQTTPNSFGEAETAPIREFMIELSQRLKESRAHTSVSYHGPDHVVSGIRDDRYSQINNASQGTMIVTRFMHDPADMRPMIMVFGLDEKGRGEIEGLQAADPRKRLRPQQSDQIVPIVARFLERFLVPATPLEGNYMTINISYA